MGSPFRPAPELDIDNAILKLMEGRIGKMNALSRDGLVYEVPMLVDGTEKITDRQIREAIQRLRTTPEGALLISDPGWSGYWFAQDYEEWSAFLERKHSTAMTLLEEEKAQRLAGERAWAQDRPQMEMFDGS